MTKPRLAHSPAPLELRSTEQRGRPSPHKPAGNAGVSPGPPAIRHQQSKISPARVTPASQFDIRPAPEMVSSGAPAIDALTGGLPRGCLTEICGPRFLGTHHSAPRRSRRREFCAVVDASDALDPQSAAAAGVELDHLLWVRCGEDAPQESREHPNGDFLCAGRERSLPNPLSTSTPLDGEKLVRKKLVRQKASREKSAHDNLNTVWSKSCVPLICCSKAEASA
jgi:hypothetical protein